MSADQPIVSIIIPTHNRQALLRRTLDGLSKQSFPPLDMEVIVVADGCSDNTANMVSSYVSQFPLMLLEQKKQGQAKARNRGANQAKAKLLLFLDDDIDPDPGLVKAHVRAHQQRSNLVVIGPYPPSPDNHYTRLHEIELHLWWEHFFRRMYQPGHRFTYQDLLGGNISLVTDLFFQVGGFDPEFDVHEDIELGARLIELGISIEFVAEALGYHHFSTDPVQILHRKRLEGRADARLSRKHPGLFFTLPISQPQRVRLSYVLVIATLAFHIPQIGDFSSWLLQKTLPLLELMRLRRSWRNLNGWLKEYWYWRGVAEVLVSRRNFNLLIDLARDHQNSISRQRLNLKIDLQDGIETVERLLEDVKPMGVEIYYGKKLIGRIKSQAGAERLSGKHLRPYLARELIGPVLEVWLHNQILPEATEEGRKKLIRSIRKQAYWFGPADPEKMWWEQYNQWQRLERERLNATNQEKEKEGYFARLQDQTAQIEAERDYWRQLTEEG